VTHHYTLLVGGTVISGRDEPDASAIAWAEDTVLALGGDDEVRAISRGDSRVVDLEGASVIPLGAGSDAGWPVAATLEVGGGADLAVLSGDPRSTRAPGASPVVTLALVRGGRVVEGMLPGGAFPDEEHGAH
jgi:predicted amidohydrolase YtcJ